MLLVLLISEGFGLADAAGAVESYLNIPGVNGEDPVPGYPDAMAVSSVKIRPNEFTITKTVDAASPSLFLAVVNGTAFGTSNLFFYNGTPTGSPDAKLEFFNTFATSYQSLDATTETVGFNAENPLKLYLEVPGIPGESSTPGHPNIMHIESWELTSNDFTIVKLLDSASDDLFLAGATGDHFPVARLLLYDSLPPGGAPDAVVEFHDLLVSAYQPIADPVQPLEAVSFNFATLSQPVPEPGAGVLVVMASMLMVATQRQSKRRGVL
jgi:type VI protein secretion system component Hcp